MTTLNIILVVFIVILWFLLGHAMRLMYAFVSGGYDRGFLNKAYCYCLAPIAACLFMFEGIFRKD